MRKLTEKEKQRLWNEILRNACDCVADRNGNRPCDNGAVCDRCSAPDIKALFDKLVAHLENQ